MRAALCYEFPPFSYCSKHCLLKSCFRSITSCFITFGALRHVTPLLPPYGRLTLSSKKSKIPSLINVVGQRRIRGMTYGRRENFRVYGFQESRVYQSVILHITNATRGKNIQRYDSANPWLPVRRLYQTRRAVVEENLESRGCFSFTLCLAVPLTHSPSQWI